MSTDPKAEARSRTEKWLEGVYKSELGRDLGDEGRKYWADDIHDRGQTQEQVIDNIRRSDEYKAYQRGKDENVTPSPGPNPNPDPVPTPKPDPDPDTDFIPWNKDKRKYGIVDGVSAAASAGNRMTDDYYQRFLPQMRKEVMLGIDEIGAADRYHADRYEGTPPDYDDPKELFDYFRNKDNKESTSYTSDLEKRIKDLEDRYGVKDIKSTV